MRNQCDYGTILKGKTWGKHKSPVKRKEGASGGVTFCARTTIFTKYTSTERHWLSHIARRKTTCSRKRLFIVWHEICRCDCSKPTKHKAIVVVLGDLHAFVCTSHVLGCIHTGLNGTDSVILCVYCTVHRFHDYCTVR